MTWHYQVTKRKLPDGTYWFEIREAYREGNEFIGWTENPITPDGESLEEVIKVLNMMLEDAKRFEVLEIED